MTASRAIARNLLEWYDRNARRLPWRVPPGEGPREGAADPYRVWLSEVMLQQTTTAHAAPYFTTFVERWPTVEALAAAPEDEVMAAWAGLGYYSRARNLIACARVVAERGRFTDNEAELRRLPGLGAYTAAAVAAIAFGRRAVVIDANVERVVARLFAIGEPLPGGKAAIRAAAEAITPHERPGDFAQGMMDLGATICTARDPKCLLCPLAAECEGRALGDPARFPVKAAKRTRPSRIGTAFWIERQGKDGARRLCENSLDVALLLGSVEIRVGLGHYLDAEAAELILRARSHRVHEVGRRVPEQGGGVMTRLQLGCFGVAELDLRSRRRLFSIGPDGLARKKRLRRQQHGADGERCDTGSGQ